MFLCLILLAGLAWFAWVKTSDAARRRPYISSSYAYYHLVMLNLFQHLTASLFLSFSADRSWNEFRMTFVYSPLIAHNSLLIIHYSKRSSVKNQNLRSSVESVSSACHWKSFTKAYFRINPAEKSKVPSWKIFISQLENYFFPVGKLKFRSRAILDDCCVLILVDNFFCYSELGLHFIFLFLFRLSVHGFIPASVYTNCLYS